MIGKTSGKWRVGSRESRVRNLRSAPTWIWDSGLTTHDSRLPTHRGFSLLELMIAMFIMIILLSLAVPTYQRSVRHAREIVLKENLFQIRKAIDQYRADKGKLPQSVDDLSSEKYLREKPIDPILERAEWNEIQGEDSGSAEGEQGLVDVKSMAEGQDLEGVAYAEY